MQTLKTAVVVVLLIAVCYGAFIALNAPDDEIPLGIQEWANGDALAELDSVDLSGGFAVDASSAVPMSAEDWPLAGQPLPLPNSPVAAEASSSPKDTSQASGPHNAAGLPELPALATPAASGAAGDLTAPELPALPGEGAAPSNTLAQVAETNQNSPQDPGPSLPDSSATLPAGTSREGSSATAGTLISATLSGLERQPSEGASGNTSLALPGPELPLPDFSSASGVGSAVDGLALPTLPLPDDQAGQLPDVAGQLSNEAPAALAGPPSVPDLPFEAAREQALAKAGQGELKIALEMLSRYYDSPELGSAEHADLVNILDALSREVIYSRRHLFESAYHVLATDTLTSIAEAHQITPELLAAINGLGASKALLARAKLKVVRGPFHAQVSLSKQEMTLFLGELYAGRFPVALGTDGPPAEGTYNVVDRRTDRTYYGPGGLVIQAGEPDNPYGGYWLSLGNNLSIHGSPEMARSDLANAGCISLAPLDAADAYIILTKASRVEIRK